MEADAGADHEGDEPAWRVTLVKANVDVAPIIALCRSDDVLGV